MYLLPTSPTDLTDFGAIFELCFSKCTEREEHKGVRVHQSMGSCLCDRSVA